MYLGMVSQQQRAEMNEKDSSLSFACKFCCSWSLIWLWNLEPLLVSFRVFFHLPCEFVDCTGGTFVLRFLTHRWLLSTHGSGYTVNAEFHFGNIIGVVLAMVTFVIAFTEALVIAGHYILDTFHGHSLSKQFVFKNLSATAVDWVFFFFFLFAPLIIMCISLFMRRPNWWEITGKLTKRS